MKIAQRVDVSTIDWTKFRYMVFDIPKHSGVYAERYAQLGIAIYFPLYNKQLNLHIKTKYINTTTMQPKENYLQQTPCKYVTLAEKSRVKDSAHLEEFFQQVIDLGGEGVILRDPLAPQVPGRSSGFLKHKVSVSFSPNEIRLSNSVSQKFRDAEARIVDSAGNYQWECELYVTFLISAFTCP